MPFRPYHIYKDDHDVIQHCPRCAPGALTKAMTRHTPDEHPEWLREQLASDAEEDQAAQATIDTHNTRANALNKKTEEDDAMHVTDEELSDCLDQLHDLDALPEYKERMAKSLNDLRDDVVLGRLSSRQLGRRVEALQDSIAEVYQEERGNRRTTLALAKAFDGFCRGLVALGERRPTPAAQQEAALMKAVYSYLPANAPARQVQQTRENVIKSFGRGGGQAVPYDRELASRLVLSKSISPVEHQNWRSFGRLPSGVDLRGGSAGRAQAYEDAVRAQSQAYASMGLSPLVFPSLVTRR